MIEEQGREPILAIPATRGTRGVHVTADDSEGMEDRMDAIRLKQILSQPLTEQELMCLQIEQNGFGCHACPSESPPPGDGGSSSG
jgi:hypothetical protein